MKHSAALLTLYEKEEQKISGTPSAMYHAFAPNRFAQKAWLHFTQRNDGCQLIGRIMGGAAFFDRERF